MDKNTNTVFLITGGNLGNRRENLRRAMRLITERVGVVVRHSRIYETEAWGITNQPPFYNQVLEVATTLRAPEVLAEILDIEEEMGRKRSTKNAARLIDIDILFFNDEVIDRRHLKVPHPHMADRRFVLMPLNELVPEKLHPVFKKTVRELLWQTGDQLKVTALA